ncbi:zinc ribbon domain-containing protein [Lactobacillus xylocopicola]|uniref:Zinc ribbon domain-containing protein n=1 Tax=Lactobacillus xylocopicola TaxID=2976676 RepID=A0ABN6SK54_9LACO|nr:zinc ribbon domain-containing protein [Lactobacillus xylocopicola]BDR60033.1 zinc ribbon domain-containing protein [Lactobacillus xylocopicola]
MKKCPKCGATMEADVNFCTACGTDLRGVKAIPKTQQAPLKQQEEPSVQPQQVEASQSANNQASGQTTGKARSWGDYWQWCLDSWKNPANNTVQAESWYGWVTILLVDLLIVLGLYFCANTLLHAAISFSNHFNEAAQGLSMVDFSFGIVLKVLLFILLYEVIMIGSTYLAHKFIYDRKVALLDFVNRSAHASNLNLIFAAIFFLLMLMGPGSIVPAVILLVVILMLFSVGQQVVLLSDEGAKRDKVYGCLIALGINFVGMLILNALLFQTIIGQMMSFGRM